MENVDLVFLVEAGDGTTVRDEIEIDDAAYFAAHEILADQLAAEARVQSDDCALNTARNQAVPVGT